MHADGSPRLFKVDVPAIDCFFSGTGDMFAALILVHLRKAITETALAGTKAWLSPDDVEATDLPLAKAVEKVLASMQAVLEKTKKARDEALEGMRGPLGTLEKEKDSEKRLHLRKTKAAEVRIVRNLADLREPRVFYQAEALMDGAKSTGDVEADLLGNHDVGGERKDRASEKSQKGVESLQISDTQ